MSAHVGLLVSDGCRQLRGCRAGRRTDLTQGLGGGHADLGMLVVQQCDNRFERAGLSRCDVPQACRNHRPHGRLWIGCPLPQNWQGLRTHVTEDLTQ